MPDLSIGQDLMVKIHHMYGEVPSLRLLFINQMAIVLRENLMSA